MSMSRRSLLRISVVATVAAAPLIRTAFAQDAAGPHTLPDLGYPEAALEPHIDAQTMTIHHSRHHASYVRGVNAAIADHSQLHEVPINRLVGMLDELPDDIRAAVRNAGGGHANHTMFWSIMGPNGGGEPTGDVAAAIARDFETFEAFQEAFNTAGLRRFGSGWVFVTVDPDGRLQVTSSPNQDSPWMDGVPVLMGNDVWEHAYYLNYQNRRGDYLQAWWHTVDWDVVNHRYARILAGELI